MNAQWIWLSEWSETEKSNICLGLFRRQFTLVDSCKEATIRISADTRYKLYVNGKLVEVGPSKGDREVWFVDTVDLKPYLLIGENVLAVEVLRYPVEAQRGNQSLIRTDFPGLFVEGTLLTEGGEEMTLHTGKKWRCQKHTGFHIQAEHPYFAPLFILENVIGQKQLHQWKSPDYKEEGWSDVYVYHALNAAVSPANLLPRTIPYMYRKSKQFEQVVVVRNSHFSKKDWQSWLQGKRRLTIPAHSEEIIEISAGMEQTGYLHLQLIAGLGASVSILAAECYASNFGDKESVTRRLVKHKRDDWQNGFLDGYEDHYTLAGCGTDASPETYEPFWFRTFRYLRLSIKTQEQPVTLGSFHYTDTGYPLEIQTAVETSNPSLKPIWDMSARTLQLCMHETYEDCPFYEQLQYAMDARQQILYTYTTSSDDRLARQCIDDFRRSARYDGLLNASYPCTNTNVIPGFSIYYILMLFDHMMYFGDKGLLHAHLPTIMGILNYFDHQLTPQGYVKKIGGLNTQERFWSFTDWTPEWEETTGVPTATLHGPLTIESLLYAMGLDATIQITQFLEFHELTTLFKVRKERLRQAIRTHLSGDNGMLKDGPQVEMFSQHVQVFAVLTDIYTKEEGQRYLLETIVHKNQYPQSSIAMAFYLYRALEKVELYQHTEAYWSIWQQMLDKGALTCVENQVDERSECHGWGALALYEFPTSFLGVRPTKPGYEAVRIDPKTDYLNWAKGIVSTPKGKVHVSWKKDSTGQVTLTYQLPEGMVLQK